MKKAFVAALAALAFGCALEKGTGPEPIRIAFTFDDGVKEQWSVAAKMLEERGWRGTFCIVNDWIGKPGKMTWDDIRDLVAHGHEIAAHTMTHSALGTLAKRGRTDRLRREVAGSRDDIARRTGFAPRLLCLPGGSVSPEVYDIARSEGMITMDPHRFCVGESGDLSDWYPDWVTNGVRRADVLTHGISKAGGGWKPFATVADFEKMLDQAVELEKAGKIVVTDYAGMRSDCRLRAKAWPRHGWLALSFDDRNYADWEQALPLLAKYGATATFFCSNTISTNELSFMRKALDAGHEIGLHGLCHRDADTAMGKMGTNEYWQAEIEPQLKPCREAGIPIFSFAYPNMRRNDATDRVFFGRGFTRLRGRMNSFKNPNPYDPKGEKLDQWRPTTSCEPLFEPAADYLTLRHFKGVIMGEAYHTDIEDVLRSLVRAGERGELFTVISHGISPDAKKINMKTEWLERILSSADEFGIVVRGVR